MDDYSKRLGKKRLRFRDWLIDKLNTREIEGVQWVDRERGLFRIPWVHGSHHTWNDNDVEIFRQWAIYSGKYNPLRDIPDHRKWKTNFRCTLNGLRDFKEVRNESSSRGPRRFKTYSLESIGKGKEEQSRREKEEKQAGPSDLADREIVQMVDEMTAPEPIARPALQKPLLVTRARPNAAYPAFETLVMGKSTGMSLFPYTPWFLAAWNAMAVDQHGKSSQTKNVEKFAGEIVAKESRSQGRAEGFQAKRLLGKQENREICNRERTFTKEELAYCQEVIDLVDRMMAADSDEPSPGKLDGREESDEADDGDDQEIIDLVDQMSDQNSSTPDELDGKEGSDEEDDGDDQEIIDLVDLMMAEDSDRPSTEGLDGTEESNEAENELPSEQEIIDLVDQMSDQSSSSLEEFDGMEGSNEEDDGDDQEIIDLVDQMSDQNSSSPDELDGKEGSDEEEDGEPSDQEIIDLVDQMSDTRDGQHGGNQMRTINQTIFSAPTEN